MTTAIEQTPAPDALPATVQRVENTDPLAVLEVEIPAELRPLLVSLLAIIGGMQFNCLSGDMWALAMYAAQDSAAKMGVTPEQFQDIYRRLEAFRLRIRQKNPLHRMF